MESLKTRNNIKTLLIILITFLCVFDLKPFESNALSKKAVNKTLKLVKKSSFFYQTYQFNIKQYSEFLKEIDFINLLQPKSDNDTLFILMRFGEFYDVSNSDLAIWNNKKEYYFSKQDTSKYGSSQEKIEFKKLILYQADKKYGLFPVSTIDYVTKWDKEGLLNKYRNNKLLGGNTVVAVRIIIDKYKYIICCFSAPELYIRSKDYDPMYTGKGIYIKQVNSIDNLPFPYAAFPDM